MSRLITNRPIIRIGLIGLLLVGGGLFLRFNDLLLGTKTPGIEQETLRQRMGKLHEHPLLDRQEMLTNRPMRQERSQITLDVVVTTPLEQTGNNLVFPPLTGFISVDQTLHRGQTYGSGTLFLSGQFFVSTSSRNSLLSGDVIGASTYSTIDFGLQTYFLWSGATTWWYVDGITLLQSGSTNDFLLVALAYIKEYEQSWITQTNSSVGVRTLQTFPLFNILAQQTDQHIINTTGGTTQLLINGKERGIDATLDTNNKITATIRFPEFGIRTILNQKTQDAYEFILSHYLVSTPLIAGNISFIPQRKELLSTGSWSGSRHEKLFYRGSHKFSIVPIPLFSITPPTQSRKWEDIVSLRQEQ